MDDIIFFGRSMGSGVVVKLVDSLDTPPAAIILVSAYQSIREVVSAHSVCPCKYLVANHMDSLSVIGNLKCPILLIHGEKDTYIPIKQSEALFEAIHPDIKQARLAVLHRRS